MNVITDNHLIKEILWQTTIVYSVNEWLKYLESTESMWIIRIPKTVIKLLYD